MPHTPLIATIAAAFTGAWLLGLLTQKLRLSPIVGYLLAGVLIGPHTPGFVGDPDIAHQLAEVGVILLMFGVGLHFHVKDLLAVKNVAIPGAIGQSLIATILAILIFREFGIPAKTGAVIGMAMAVASTVVLMRVLMDADVLNSPQGHVAVGWLIVEDVFTVILLVLIPVLGEAPGSATVADAAHAAAPPAPLWQTLGIALAKLAALVAILLVAGARVVPWVLVQVARLRSRELFTLTVLVFSIAVAAASYYVFGASMALGAFLAGMVVAQSPVSHQAAADALPMRDAFAVIFFVSVGMLFDPHFLIEEPLMVAAALGIILIVKPVTALLIVVLLGHSVRTALTVAIGLGQIGEFSFILSELAHRHGLMPSAGHNVLVASAIISITLNPLLFRSLPSIESWLRRRPALWSLLNRRAERRVAAAQASTGALPTPSGEQRLAIVVGYGPVGRSVHRLLAETGMATVVIDLNMDTVRNLSAERQSAIYGDASHESILEQAGARRASHLVLTLPHPGDRAAIVAAARNLNPKLRILVRARYLREREDLEQAGATAAVFEEVEAAVALARLVLADAGVHRDAADQKIKDLRLQLIMENITNIRTQRVRSVMVPWSRVRSLTTSMNRDVVLAQVSQERFSRWPVLDGATRRPVGYLLAKDLVANASDANWLPLVRRLHTIAPDDTIDAALSRMQVEGASVYVVEDQERPVGLITLEDILEQVVGQIEDEYPHEAAVSLREALARGAILLSLHAGTHDEAIREVVAAVPPRALPAGVDAPKLTELVMAREAEISTDLGNGIAIPHARCSQLAAPIVVFARSESGVQFSAEPSPPVHVILLLITAAEQPEAQLALLARLARSCREPEARAALRTASTREQVLSLLTAAQS